MPLPLTVSCFSKIQIGSTFLVPAHLGSPGKRAVKRMCVCLAQDTIIFTTKLVEINVQKQKILKTGKKLMTIDLPLFLVLILWPVSVGFATF